MLFRINLLLMQIILFLLFQNKMLFASDMEKLNCKGIFWSHKEAQYAEWQVIKRVSTYKVYFKINDLKKTAKVSFRKGNAGVIIGMGGWENKAKEKSSLSFSYSITQKIFKMKSRYTDTRIEGKCVGKINL